MTKIIFKKEIGERVDKFLAETFPDYSRSYFEKLIEENQVRVNQCVIKPSQILKRNDELVINFPEKAEEKIEPQKIKLNVIYEDQNVIVINKEAGMVVHPAAGHHDNTLVNALLSHFPSIAKAVADKKNAISNMRPGLVHRLDKDTSGVMIVAKNARALKALSKQIQNRTIVKKYIGLCYGWPKEQQGIIQSFLGRHPKNRKKISELPEGKGKEAITHYKVIKNFLLNKEKVSLIEFEIKTGRTHQIRVHISRLGNPILGDREYGNKPSNNLSNKMHIERQMLHSKLLAISLPGDPKHTTFEAPLPRDFKEVIDKL